MFVGISDIRSICEEQRESKTPVSGSSYLFFGLKQKRENTYFGYIFKIK